MAAYARSPSKMGRPAAFGNLARAHRLGDEFGADPSLQHRDRRPAQSVCRIDEIVTQPFEPRAERLDQRPRSELSGNEGKAEQGHTLPRYGRLDGAALIVEADAPLAVESLQPCFLGPSRPGRHAVFQGAGPPIEMDERRLEQIRGPADGQV